MSGSRQTRHARRPEAGAGAVASSAADWNDDLFWQRRRRRQTLRRVIDANAFRIQIASAHFLAGDQDRPKKLESQIKAGPAHLVGKQHELLLTQ